MGTRWTHRCLFFWMGCKMNYFLHVKLSKHWVPYEAACIFMVNYYWHSNIHSVSDTPR
jgi:hypothetical protein